MRNKEVFYSDIQKRAQSIYEGYQDIMKNTSRKDMSLSETQLKFFIKNDGRLGGKAWCKNNIDHIEINTGVISNFFDYFIGFAEELNHKFINDLHFKISKKQGDDVSFLLLLQDENKEGIILNNKTIDYNLASLLTVFVSRFILTHELGHLLNGHCQYLNNNDLSYIPMYYINRRTNNIFPLDIKTMEMDADFFAGTDSFRYLLILYNHFEKRVDPALLIKPIDLFFWWSFAIRSNFLISQHILNDEEYSTDRTHLPSVARFVLILTSIVESIDNGIYKINYRSGDSEEKLVKKLLDGAMYAEEYYNSKFHTEYAMTETMKNEKYVNTVSDLETNWDNLRNKLISFSRLPLFGRKNRDFTLE
ncbi:hypothetical protein FO510_10260 [Bacillus pumilus]|uniref:hypothetical protein n=1 Tax=Bacillus pumilus TaxID=1408 RepID=UPI00017A6931|nr:hypothetical protein [Bacillus pumilus]EDW21201.1 hypothetical protein BAT_2176 [Bacillus pumilus ATCC 7061]MCR4353973.1 hypothetical protein [Bacillus pumilus]MCY7506261.1 hypothetical protein [Bacillus pumilus]MDR4270038.1 hypothetical protein [Bacillus pumilus]MED4627534.1 hypothetical protein [Bacillus pumilus]